MIDESQFVDVYSLTTKQKQRVPRAWLDDPILGRDFAKTPSQRELDGELPARPAGDAAAAEIDGFAEAAGLDLAAVGSEADKLVAIEEAFGSAPVQEHAVDVEAGPVAADPLAPEVAANVDVAPPAIQAADPESADDGADPVPAGPYAGDDWSFQALKDEIDRRNEGREDADRLSKGGSAEDLRARLTDDDEAQSGDGDGGDADESTRTDSTDSTDSTPNTEGDTESSDDTPAAGDEEN